jgi:hypothetical protein
MVAKRRPGRIGPRKSPSIQANVSARPRGAERDRRFRGSIRPGTDPTSKLARATGANVRVARHPSGTAINLISRNTIRSLWAC